MYEIVLKMYEMMLLASVDKETESAKRHDGDSCGATTDGSSTVIWPSVMMMVLAVPRSMAISFVKLKMLIIFILFFKISGCPFWF